MSRSFPAAVLSLALGLSTGCGEAGDGGSTTASEGATGLFPAGVSSASGTGGTGGTGTTGSTGGGSTAGGTTGSGTETGRMAGMAAAHNTARTAEGATPPLAGMTWDETLVTEAAAWAAKCKWEHSMGASGENLYAYGGSTAATTPTKVVTSWMSEKPDWNFATKSCGAGKVCGHYTQVVWRSSIRVGCAFKACTTGSPFSGFPNWEFWVCEYGPPGNYRGQNPY